MAAFDTPVLLPNPFRLHSGITPKTPPTTSTPMNPPGIPLSGVFGRVSHSMRTLPPLPAAPPSNPFGPRPRAASHDSADLDHPPRLVRQRAVHISDTPPVGDDRDDTHELFITVCDDAEEEPAAVSRQGHGSPYSFTIDNMFKTRAMEWLKILSELTVHVTSPSGREPSRMHRVLDRAAVLTLLGDMRQELSIWGEHNGYRADRVEEIVEILTCYAEKDNTASDPLRRAVLRHTMSLLEECI